MYDIYVNPKIDQCMRSETANCWLKIKKKKLHGRCHDDLTPMGWWQPPCYAMGQTMPTPWDKPLETMTCRPWFVQNHMNPMSETLKCFNGDLW